jgi:hypothetical protein
MPMSILTTKQFIFYLQISFQAFFIPLKIELSLEMIKFFQKRTKTKDEETKR